jgi:hypothetical protein
LLHCSHDSSAPIPVRLAKFCPTGGALSAPTGETTQRRYRVGYGTMLPVADPQRLRSRWTDPVDRSSVWVGPCDGSAIDSQKKATPLGSGRRSPCNIREHTRNLVANPNRL